MPGKEQIVEELGDLLMPNLVNRALAANDRAKYLMTLLQTAREHADHPHGGAANLKRERMACGLDDVSFDEVVERSSRVAQDVYRIPNADRIEAELTKSLEVMLSPLRAAAELPDQPHNGRADEYVLRLEQLTVDKPLLEERDLVSGGWIDQITTTQPASGDSFHLLVMHLHKELNALQRQIASESIDGALVYGVTDSDRRLIAAFMRGINRTRKLKFDHPGLDTTATRAEERLVIQNDIGTTDAHVLVIHVSESQVVITYTDVHIQRLVFFQNLLRRFQVEWEDTRSRRSTKLTESLYHLATGRYTAENETQLAEYLEFLASRLVFLIDWNRARKRLRKLAPKAVCLEVLQWAAEHDLGHMAFLKLGGEQLAFDALRLSSRVPLQIGGQLADIIGPKRAAEFLKFTLKTTSLGLQANQSELLIRDHLRAELRHYLDTAHQGLLELATDHAALIVELSAAARDCLLFSSSETDPDFLIRTGRRAKTWEHLADQLVTKARNARGASVESRAAAELLRTADDAADDLEEGIFLMTLLEQQFPEGLELISESRDVLQDLVTQLVYAAQEYMKAVENARCINRDSPREDMADFLQAVDRTISLEHQIDDAHRQAKASILRFCDNFKQLHLFNDVADKLESASDAMMRSALLLRDYVLGEVITR